MFLTQDTGAILGPISKIFGMLMNAIYEGLCNIGVGNIGLAILIFTLITRIILLPATIKQQKSAKLTAIIQPEINAIRKKYEGKTDQASMMNQQQEIKAVYEKYGTSMTGGCLQLVIQMPIIIALYRVIMNIPAYVVRIKQHFDIIVEEIGGLDAVSVIKDFAENNNLQKIVPSLFANDFSAKNIVDQKNIIVDFLYKLNPKQFEDLIINSNLFPNANLEVISENIAEINEANSFCGLNLVTAPSAYGLRFSPYLLIPVFAFVSQYISSLYMQKANKTKLTDENDQMQQTMKTMNIMFPVMSAFFCYSLATGIGVYWIASAVFMTLTQVFINAHLNKIDLDVLVAQNIEKANKKREKKGLPPIDPKKTANTFKMMEEKVEKTEQERNVVLENQQEKQEQAEKFYFENEDKDSLFAKANMVSKYNEKNKK